MPTREIHHLGHLGFRHLEREHANNGKPLLVDGQHDLERLRVVEAEKPFEDMHHEFHRGVIIVQQQHLIKRRALRARAGLRQDRSIRSIPMVFVGHHEGAKGHGALRGWRADSGSVQTRNYSGKLCHEKGLAKIPCIRQGPAMARITFIGFDADDTLWQNETFFRLTQERFESLLADHADPAHLHDRLLAAERRNVGHYGFGVKGFVLSMIETAIEVTEGRVQASVIAELMAAGREMLAHPIELLPHARDAVVAAADHGARVVLITKGDLLDQERKLAQSGLGDLFHGVEIVSNKTADVYARLFTRHGVAAEGAMMLGNSLKSDVLPVLETGGWGVHVPHHLTWALEHAEPPHGHERFCELSDLGGLLPLLNRVDP